jgi:hypothetical protein
MLPNFLVVGAGRSGTTSLHDYLVQHPQVYLPAVKAPSYFYCHRPAEGGNVRAAPVSRDYFVCDTAAYEALFDDVRDETAVGEVSPAYLASMWAVEQIADQLPEARIVMILRNPVERFHARYVARVRDGLESAPSVDALIEQEKRARRKPDDAVGTYLDAGFCSHFVAAYLERFPGEQLHIGFFDDLQADAAQFMRRLHEFLQVDPDFTPDLARRLNASGGYIRNPVLRGLWAGSADTRAALRPLLPRKLRDQAFRWATADLVAQPLDASARRELLRIYTPEIESLQTLTGRDLNHWLQTPP